MNSLLLYNNHHTSYLCLELKSSSNYFVKIIIIPIIPKYNFCYIMNNLQQFIKDLDKNNPSYNS